MLVVGGFPSGTGAGVSHMNNSTPPRYIDINIDVNAPLSGCPDWPAPRAGRKCHIDRRLADFSADSRLVVLTGCAAAVGVASAFVALALVRLIGFFTNLFYYGRLSGVLVSPADNRLGLWAVAIPMIGGLIIGLMARYGS